MELFSRKHAMLVATREFSKNPSKVLRNAAEHPVVVTKYGQPVACLVSMDYWYSLMRQMQEKEFDEQVARAGDYAIGDNTGNTLPS